MLVVDPHPIRRWPSRIEEVIGLVKSRDTTLVEAVRDFWWLEILLARAFVQGVQRNKDESRCQDVSI